MKREEIKDTIGEMIVIGYQPEVITLNPNDTLTYHIIITSDEKLYISEGEKEEWEYVAKDEFANVKGLFDEKNDIARFKIKSGKYVGEYIIEDITITEDFKKKIDYLSWMK